MEKSILTFEEIGRGDVETAGGKGANLGELTAKGFPVPPGFVVSAGACEDFFKRAGLESECRLLANAAAGEMDGHTKRIRSRVESTEIPPGLAENIMAAYDHLVEKRGTDIACAVRSSATAEDLDDASFAGQHATYYYVKKKNLLKMVKSCWVSLWNPEAVSYRATRGIDHGSVFMAVVVQEMIRSEISGVTFTANPVTGKKSEIVTESSWGMGAAIVDGRVTPDHYVIERNQLRLLEKRIADKRFMVPHSLKENNGGRLQEVPHHMRHRETLSSNQAREVGRWSLKAEAHFGVPQDVEWAITDGQYFMLQSRPITVMGHKEIGQDEKGQYVVFKPLVENFTDPITPLSWDLMDKATLPGMKRIGGRAYLYLRPLRAILPFKASEAELSRWLYEMGASKPDLKLSWIKLPVFLSCLFIFYLLTGVFFARTRRLPDHFMDGYRELCERVAADSAMGPVETIRRLWPWYQARFFDPAGLMIMLVNVSAARYMFFLGLLQKVLRHWIPEIREDAESLLCSGQKGVLSAEMGRGIWELARIARDNRQVRRIFKANKPEELLGALKEDPEAYDFLRQLDRFLDQNGHRALKELELQSVRWAENPAPVLGMVRNYLLVENDPQTHEEEVEKARTALKNEIREILKKRPLERVFRFRWHLIRYLSGRTKHFAKMRENSRFYHILGLYHVRKKILKIEAELMKRGDLRCRDDIFYLTCDEIDQMRSGALGWRDVEDRVRDRRMEHIRLSKMAPPKTIGIQVPRSAPFRPTASESSHALKGQPAAPGNYTGLAHVILDPSIDIELTPGEILIAPYTDPAWTPLFLTAGAAVVEIGSYLSHAGTVAREFGMPCVVDLPDCTRKIQTGDRVMVDGSQGIVQLVSEKEGERS